MFESVKYCESAVVNIDQEMGYHVATLPYDGMSVNTYLAYNTELWIYKKS